tara:strand:+ start:1642 stop:2079 length:438 start_codon:yes stop_codon:yes gene_type:complete
MPQLERSLLNVKSLPDVTRVLNTLADLFNNRISFGEPDDGAGNPRGDNIQGAWATATFTALDTATTVTHNLRLNTAGTINCRWLIGRIEHSGTAADGTSAVSIQFETGDTVNTNDIQLRCYVAATRTVDGDNPVTADLFFIPAVT